MTSISREDVYITLIVKRRRSVVVILLRVKVRARKRERCVQDGGGNAVVLEVGVKKRERGSAAARVCFVVLLVVAGAECIWQWRLGRLSRVPGQAHTRACGEYERRSRCLN